MDHSDEQIHQNPLLKIIINRPLLTEPDKIPPLCKIQIKNLRANFEKFNSFENRTARSNNWPNRSEINRGKTSRRRARSRARIRGRNQCESNPHHTRQPYERGRDAEKREFASRHAPERQKPSHRGGGGSKSSAGRVARVLRGRRARERTAAASCLVGGGERRREVEAVENRERRRWVGAIKEMRPRRGKSLRPPRCSPPSRQREKTQQVDFIFCVYLLIFFGLLDFNTVSAIHLS
jgi:hypothetical protein